MQGVQFSPLSPSSVDNPIPEFAALSLRPRGTDLKALVEEGVIDSRARVIGHAHTFSPKMPLERIRSHLTSPLVCHGVETSLGAIHGSITRFLKIPPGHLGGSELFKVLGVDFIKDHFPFWQLLSPHVIEQYTERACQDIQRLTLQFSGSHEIDSIEGLFSHLRETFKEGIKEPFHDPANRLSSILIQTEKFEIKCVFGGPAYFASVEALHVHLAPTPALLDHGKGMQWAVDTLFQIIRVQKGVWKNPTHDFFRFLMQGYTALEDEYKHCIPVYFQAASPQEALLLFSCAGRLPTPFPGDGWVSKSIELIREHNLTFPQWEAVVQLVYLLQGRVARFTEFPEKTVFRIENIPIVHDIRNAVRELATLSQAFFHSPIFLEWLTSFPRQVPGRPLPITSLSLDVPARELVGFLCSLLLAQEGTSFQLTSSVAKQFPKIASTCPQPLLGCIYRATQRCLQRLDCILRDDILNGHLDLQAYIELLFSHPTLQGVAFDLLYELPGHVALKKKWVSTLFTRDENRARSLIQQLLGEVQEPLVRQWLQAARQKDALIRVLFQDQKWQRACVESDSVASLGVALESGRVPEATTTLFTKKVEADPGTFLSLLSTPQSIERVLPLVQEALKALTTRKCTIPEEVKKEVRGKLPNTLDALERMGLYNELLLALKVAQQYLFKTFPEEMIPRLREAIEKAQKPPKNILSWAKDLVKTEQPPTQSAPPPSPPQKEAPQDALTQLIQKRQWQKAALYVTENRVASLPHPLVKGLLSMTPPGDVVSLFERYQVVKTTWWNEAFATYHQKKDYKMLGAGFLVLNRMKNRFSAETHRQFYTEYFSFDVLMHALPLIQELVQDLAWFKKLSFNESDMQYIVQQMVKAGIEATLSREAFASLPDWLSLVPGKRPESGHYALALFRKAMQLEDGFDLSCSFLTLVLPCLKVRTVTAQECVKTYGFVPEFFTEHPKNDPIQDLRNFMHLAKKHTDSPRCAASLIALAEAIRALDVVEMDGIVIEDLYDVTLPTVRQALIPSLSAVLQERNVLDRECAALLKPLLAESSLDTTFKLYHAFLFTKDLPLPSEKKTHELPGPVTLGEVQHPEVCAAFAERYGFYLLGALASSNIDHIHQALDIECALLHYYPHTYRARLHEYVTDPTGFGFDLFLAFLDRTNDWTPTAINFCYHLFEAQLKPLYAKRSKQEQDREHFGLTTFASPVVVSYQQSLHTLMLPSLFVSKFTSELLPSEKFFLFLCRSLLFKIYHNTTATPILLDLAASILRNLIERYPHSENLGGFISSGVYAVPKESDHFTTHLHIMSGIIRQALFRGVTIEDLSKCHQYLGTPQPAPAIEINPEQKVTFEEFVAFQTRICRRQQTECTGEYAQRDALLTNLFLLLKHNPHLLERTAAMMPMEMILAPNALFFGMGRGDEGNFHALCIAEKFINILFDLLQEQEGTLKIACMSWLLFTLKCAKQYRAFQYSNSAFDANARRFINLVKERTITLNARAAAEFTSIIGMGVGKIEDRIERLLLMDFWLVTVLPLYREANFQKAIISNLLTTTLITECTIETFPQIKNWLELFTPHQSNTKLVGRLSAQCFLAIKPIYSTLSSQLPEYIQRAIAKLFASH